MTESNSFASMAKKISTKKTTAKQVSPSAKELSAKKFVERFY